MSKKTFAKATKNFPPNKLLRDAARFIKEKGKALDIGAGSLRDAKFLSEQGFKEIVAIDKEKAEVADEKIRFIQTKIQDFDFPQESYDVVVAINSLPFLKDADFNEVFPKVIKSLKKGGVLCLTLFGENDEWNTAERQEKMNFKNKEQTLNLLKDFDAKTFIEEEREGMTINKEMKHWHIFRVIAVKE